MDKVIEQKPRKVLTRQRLLVGLLLVPAIATAVMWSQSHGDGSIDRDGLVISEVERSDFKVSVRGSGTLVPDNIQWLTAEVDATVAKLVAKAGTVVKQGDVIVELSNPRLVQELAQTKWDMEAEEAAAHASEVQQKVDLLEQEAAITNFKMNYESKALREKALGQLISTHQAYARVDYEQTKLEASQFKERWRIGEEQLEQMRRNISAQDSARAAQVNKARKAYESVRERVENLQVRATMDSIVLESPLKAGQRVAMGENIAKLAQENMLIAELRVPEIQIRDVALGQQVTIDTRNNKVRGVVSRIDPAVVNGHVQIDVAFSEPLPSDARPDLSVDGEIVIAQIPNTLNVNRPLFAQSRSRSTVYRVSEDGRTAERINVTLGYGSVNRIQIVDGLQANDRIITSDPTRFEKFEKFRIN
jgi:HlyD family secretion protein